MKAVLILENIGQYRGRKLYDINSGLINLFQGKNSLGKTTIIKSIGTALSSPIQSEKLIIEANKFGILPRDKKKGAQLVNYDVDQANISLKYDEQNINVNIQKDGTIKTNFKGNEVFLYSGMLMKNSKILENLASGDYNFQWIVSEMSNASKYEEIKSIIDSYINLTNVAKFALEDFNKKIGIYLSEIDDLEKKKKALNEELEKVQEDMNSLELPNRKELDELKNQESKKNNEIKGVKNQLEANKDKIKRFDYEIKEIDNEISSLDDEIEDEENKVKEEKQKLEIIESYNKREINQQINNYVDNVKPPLNQDLGKVKGIQEIFNNLKRAKYESKECPICESNIVLDQGIIGIRIKDLRLKEEDLEKEIEVIDIEVATLRNKIKEIENIPILKRKIDYLDGTIRQKEGDKSGLIRKKDEITHTGKGQLLGDKEDFENKLKKLRDKLAAIIKQKDEYAEKNKEAEPFLKKEKQLNAEINKTEGNIERIEKEIEKYSEFELFNQTIPFKKVDKIIKQLSAVLEKILNFLIDRINEQRLGAGKKFNSTIKKVIEELDLPNFENIFLDLDNYNLKIVGKGGKLLPEGSLGGGEKATIGGILQLSCKLTYLKEIPFFIGDDLILDFDPENTKKFMNYLKKLAEEEDLFIIMTRPTNDKEIVQVEM